MSRVKIKAALESTSYGHEVLIKGWVRTKRESKQVAFVALNDGSCLSNIQIVLDPKQFDEALKDINTGACLAVRGKLSESQGSG